MNEAKKRAIELIRDMEVEAMDAAVGGMTGKSSLRGMFWVRYFPSSKRFQWMEENRVITKRMMIEGIA